MTRIVITGMGIISPYGVGPELLWGKLNAGENAVHDLTGFDTAHLQCQVGGQISDFRAEQFLPPRTIRKIDRFSIFGLACSQLALRDAGLLLNTGKSIWSQHEDGGNRVGITVGNALGGWEFAERELRNLWVSGPRAISPYMATAWFPAAVQGNVSIQFSIKGLGRTFVSDRASGALALIHAANTLLRDKADIMLAGGTEAPFSPYAALCCETSGLMSTRAASGATSAYRPFDQGHSGLIAGEGGTFFVLERLEDARKRDVPILAELAGWASTNDGYDPVQVAPDGQRYAAAMTQSLERAQVAKNEVDCVFAAGSAIPTEDLAETRALHLAFGDAAPHIPISTPKSAFGNLLGAASALDVAIAILAMQEGVIPATLNIDQAAQGCDLDYIPQTARPVDRFDTCLVNARGIGGSNASLVLRRWTEADAAKVL
jgi:3-oxoacyl-(acyl-carrier-protein) synthase